MPQMPSWSATAAGKTWRAGRLTVYEMFRARARRQPEALAVEHVGGQLTYAALNDRVLRLAHVLSNHGLKRGDRVAILSENRLEYVELELAAARNGLIVACQNWRLAAGELRHCITLVEPKLVLVSARYADTLAQLGLDLPVINIDADYEQLLAGTPSPADIAAAGDPEVDPEDGLVILYTSGTTGLPKGALISHRAEIARMMVLAIDLDITSEDGFVAWAPLFHMGSTDQTLAALMAGAPVIIVDGFDARRIVDAVARYKLGWLLLMPGSIEPVVEFMRREGTMPKGVKVCGAMADLVPLQLITELTRLMRAPYLNSFGATETGLPPGSGAVLPAGEVPKTLSKRLSSLCDVMLVDPDGNPVPDGEPGEVAIRGATVFSGYWNAEETNARDFANGWFRMGDLFRKNPDGTYDFVDRAKYMIKSGGENIYPAEIERVLLSDARVADAVVVRKRDARWGEVPVAFVARHSEDLTEQEIETLCRRALAGYKRPKEVRFIAFADFPRSTTGKILRHELEKLL
ncbi:class I adenylate-forming enzyme family protein [Rhodoligotrophos defluvii]|uniref:class I adenylate-forming enzyme family protein n=1 Tax=Rhodoligotrophos defluvii TaxID=2561934 RepID=UPI001EF02186|nr:class I adenylate-forming enzyme family protein [Rhodoligotrophos defluvii]